MFDADPEWATDDIDVLALRRAGSQAGGGVPNVKVPHLPRVGDGSLDMMARLPGAAVPGIALESA